MSKHTPGPWVIERNSGLQIYITQPQDKANRTPGFYAEVRRFTPDTEQVEANARLIAAAPEMLEALRWLDAEMDCRDDDYGGVLFSRGDFERVRRAIKLAMEG